MNSIRLPLIRFVTLLAALGATATLARAAENEGPWEPFADGSIGRVTEYLGVHETSIAAYLRKPKGDGPFPVVVLLHGGGNSKEGTYALGRLTASPTANFIAAGWAVYSIDFRPQAPFQPIEWDDARLAVEGLKKILGLDGSRVAMFGNSHGGYNTARAASRMDLRCAIPCAAAAIDPIEVAKAHKAGEAVNVRALDAIRRQAEGYGLTLEQLTANPPANYNPPLTEVSQVRCPIFIISGRNDPASPPSVMETYAARLRAAGKEVELYLPDNGPHGFVFGRPRIPETEEAARRMVAFISKHFSRSAKSVVAATSSKSESPPRSRANSIDRLEKFWVDPDKTEPDGTKYRTFQSRMIGGEVSYLLYLPPDYDRARNTRYPVLYWLHGTGSRQSRAAEVVKRLDAAIGVSKAPPMIVVLVNGLRGATMYCDTRDGKWPLESVITRDLVPHIDATYRTIARREGRAVEGFSMGGFGAAHLGFKYPEVFGVVSILAPALLGPDLKIRWEEHFSFVFNNDLAAYEAENPFQLAARNAEKLRGRSIIRLVPHDEPGKWLIPRCDQLHAVLEKHNIAHEYDPRRDVNRHDYVLLYDALGEKALSFYTKAFAGVVNDAKVRKESAQRAGSAAQDQVAANWEELPDSSVGKGFTYRTADGLELPAYIRKPAGAGPFPLVVFLPGGGGQRDAASRMGRSTGHPISDFVAEGWAVCALSYRPPDPPTPNMDPREWDDIAAAMATLRAFPFVDTKRVALVGHSHGARIVTMMASRVDARCGVSMAPVTLNLVEMMKRREKGEVFNAAAKRMMDNMEKIHGAKILEQPERFLRFSPFPEVKQVRFPLLMMYAEDDNGGPIEIVQAYVEELKSAGKEVEAYYPKQGGHGVFFGQPRVVPETAETARRAVAFIRRQFDLPAKAATTRARKSAAVPVPAPKVQQTPLPGSLSRLQLVWMDPNTKAPELTRYEKFHSRTINGDVSCFVYVPPDYDEAQEKRYPTLYWLHGTGNAGPRAGAQVVGRIDRAIRAGHAPPLIVVLVNGLAGATMFCDTKDGNWPVESVIINELIPHIDESYRTLARRERRAIEGFSMGGFGAAHLGFKYPEIFGVVSILAPALLGPEAPMRWPEHFSFVFQNDLSAYMAENPFELAVQNADRLRGRTVIRMVPHDEAGKWLIPRCDALHAVLEKNNIPHRYDVRRDVGTHDFRLLYDALGDDAFGYYAKAFARPLEHGSALAGARDPSATPNGVPDPPICYDLARTYPNEIPQYQGLRASRNVEPFEILDGLYYVGNSMVSSYLLRTAAGLILIDTPVPHQVPWLLENIRKVGFLPSDVRVVIGGHWHFDHIGGTWYFQKHFGAQAWMHEGDASNAETGAWKAGELAPLDGGLETLSHAFPPFKVDRRINGGETIEWGGRKLTFHHTPGHTPGSIAIEFSLRERSGRELKAVWFSDPTPYREQFQESCRRMLSVDAQVWVTSHPNHGKILEKAERLRKGPERNPFIDPQGWKGYMTRLSAGGAPGGRPTAQMLKSQAARAEREPAQGGSDRIKEMFERLDANGDGRIAAEEASSDLGKRFLERFDKDKDGIVKLEEIGGASSGSPSTSTKKSADAFTDPVPPVCYDISKPFPGEIGQYRVSRESKPVEPFEILDGLYYVGNSQVSAHLLTTTNGLVLMDSTMPHQVSWLLESIRKLGFNPRDVKVVIGNHAHLDHIGGHWYFQHYFGAQTWLHEADAAATEISAWKPGQPPVELDGTLNTLSAAFPPFKTDRKLHDGETIEWGGRRFTFHLAAGHTPGTLFTQFPLRDKSSGRIVMAGMLGGFGMGRPSFAETVAKLRAVDVQLVLGAHPNQNQTFDKQRRLQTGAQPNPFIDPTGWAQFLDRLGALAERMRSPTSSKK